MKKHSEEFRRWQLKFYKNKRWIETRNFIRYNRDKGICQRCKKVILADKWIVDHKIEINEQNKTDPKILYDPSNLELLCISCHNKKTFFKKKEIISEMKKDRDPFDKYK